jgi:hypothetical protein
VKNYYSILGLPVSAGGDAIKKAYRKLAFMYHPDRNPTKEAEDRFKEINAAYEVLSDPTSRREYDLKILQQTLPVHRDPRYRKQPRKGQEPTAQQRMFLYMKQSLPYTNKILLVSFLVCGFLIVDYLLPPRQTTDEIVNMSMEADNVRRLYMNDGSNVKLSHKLARRFRLGSDVIVYRSNLLSVPLAVENQQTKERAEIYATFYRNFSFVPLLMLGFSVFGLFLAKEVETRFNMGIVNGMLLLFLMILFFFQQ